MENQLLWSQEFSSGGNPLSEDHWTYEIGDGGLKGIPGWGNNERQYYISEAFELTSDGMLSIAASRQQVFSKDNPEGMPTAENPYFCWYLTACEWTSGRALTEGKLAFQYGRMEARMKMPRGLGTWPAFWMLGVNLPEVGWPRSGEIDIIEGLGRDPLTAYTTIHGPGYSAGAAHGRHAPMDAALADDFHTYAVIWKEDYIAWEIDGELFFEATPESVAPNEWVFNQPFYLIINLAMGGNFPGNVAPELNSAELLIDYIRFYKVDGIGELIEYPKAG
jgi:beta-glucanase (GH16 family)